MEANHICTERMLLRPWLHSDVDRLVLMTQDPGFHSDWGLFRGPMDRAQVLAWVNNSIETMQSERLGAWAMVEHQHVVGVAILMWRWPDGEKQPLLSVEYRLLSSARGRGLATEATLALIEYGHKEHGLREFHALIAPSNTLAKKVAFKVGMTYLRMASMGGEVVEVFHLHVTPGHPGSRFSAPREEVA